jgi:hypothetical protein
MFRSELFSRKVEVKFLLKVDRMKSISYVFLIVEVQKNILQKFKGRILCNVSVFFICQECVLEDLKI